MCIVAERVGPRVARAFCAAHLRPAKVGACLFFASHWPYCEELHRGEQCIVRGYSHLQSTQSVKSSDCIRLHQTASDCSDWGAQSDTARRGLTQSGAV